MGTFLACMLFVPDFTAMIGTDASFSVYGIPAPVNDYGQSILPILISVWIMSYVDKFFRKVLPDTLSTIFAPFFTMVVMAPVTFCAVAPLGNYLGVYLGEALTAFGNVGGFLAVGILGALYEFIVLSGMHGVLILSAIMLMLQNGSEAFVLTAAGCATWAAFGIAFGAFLRLKNRQEKSLALGAFISGFIGGVVEPSLYGVGFKYRKPFIALAIGGFAGGVYAGLTHVAVYVAGTSNFLVVLGYVGGGTANTVNGLISSFISFAVAAAVTYIAGFDKNELALKAEKKE